MYTQYKSKGFTVLAFPSNEFGKQEPGTNEEIQAFVTSQFGVTFPMFAKIRVNGKDGDPVFKFLRSKLTGTLGQSLKWNFTKFLVDRDGIPLKRYGTATDPNSMLSDIEAALLVPETK